MTQDIAAQIADLSARLERLEAERAVNVALYRYAHAIDYGDRDTWVDCFTPDGAFDVLMPPGGPARPLTGFGTPHARGTRYCGHGDLRQFIGQHTRAPEVWHKHIMVEPVMSFSPGLRQVNVRSYFLMVDEPEGRPDIRAFGRYLDDMRLGDDGRWRFFERVAEIESMR